MDINRETKKCKETKVIQTHRVLLSDLNQHRTLFGGKLMSIIDNTASISATRHSRGIVVTASMDSLDFLHPIYEDHSVCVESYVTGVGQSSMEVFAKVMGEDLLTGKRYLAATSFITFVCRPTEGNQKIIVPLIEPESVEEKFVCEDYEVRRKKRINNLDFNERFGRAVAFRAPWLDADLNSF
ncbi:MAG: Acyl-CoA hydrolase [Haloplasmataceae bacterium]|nr:Acyl-CoA hydrolase [Haloplasmataceae bacterium]